MMKLDKDKILQEIREKGVEFVSVNDLLKLNKNYKNLIPVILKHLMQISDEKDKDLLIRSLGVRGFDEATDALINEFYKAESTTLKWAIANTLASIMDKNSLPALLKIAQEKEHGIARQMVVVALGKMKDPSVTPVLLELLHDEDVVGHAVMAIGYLKDMALVPYIEPFTEYKVRWIRKEAKKAIKKTLKANGIKKDKKEKKARKQKKQRKPGKFGFKRRSKKERVKEIQESGQ